MWGDVRVSVMANCRRIWIWRYGSNSGSGSLFGRLNVCYPGLGMGMVNYERPPPVGRGVLLRVLVFCSLSSLVVGS